MATIRTFLVLAAIGLAGRTTAEPVRFDYSPLRPSCPAGTYLVCAEDSPFGNLIVLN